MKTGIEAYTSRVIIALDPPPGVDALDWAASIVDKLKGRVAGFKVGLPLLARSGYGGLAALLSRLTPLRIADFKLADIPAVMWSIVEPVVYEVDAVIAHAFVGPEALAELRDRLREAGVELILVYHMSHRGAESTFGRCIDVIDSVVERVKPWGLVAPATLPAMILRARRRYPDVVIISPGVGAQGARPGEAICAGADYEIIGRSVTRAEDPLSSLYRLAEEGAARLASCIGRDSL